MVLHYILFALDNLGCLVNLYKVDMLQHFALNFVWELECHTL